MEQRKSYQLFILEGKKEKSKWEGAENNYEK